MSTAPTRRQALLGTAAFSLSLGGVLLPGSAHACHLYKSPVDGRVGCGARDRDLRNGVSGDSGSTSTNTSTSTDTGTSTQQSSTSTNTDTQSGSGDPQVSGSTIRVSNASQLANALGSAKAGHRIELADGSYSGTFRITNSGTSSNPILIEADNRLKAQLGSQLTVAGNYVVVSGLSFNGAGVVLSANNCRVTRCYFDRSGTAIYAMYAANSAEIDRNEIARWTSRGIEIRGTNAHVYRNYLHSSNSGPACNLGAGGGHTKRTKALFEYNLIENSNDGKTFFTKTSDCIIRFNTFVNCQGLTNRNGFSNSYIGNWLEDCYSFRVNDENCRVEGNRLIRVRLGLLILAGDVSSSQFGSGGKTYPYANNCQVFDNDTNKITVGQAYSSMSPVYPAASTVLRGNKGSISYSRHTKTQFISSDQGNAGRLAVKLGRSDVGPQS